MGLFDKTVAASLKFVPKGLVRRVARQYIAGDTLADAIVESRRLNEAGCTVTMDLLGEDIHSHEEAAQVAAEYHTMLDAIAEHGIDGNVSVKPTAVGLTFGVEAFLEHMLPILDKAREHDNWARIDMEDHPTTDDTLEAYRQLRARGYDNTGVVFQAMLFRTMDDVKALEPLKPRIRMCKGIYAEPPEIAWQGYDEVNKSFLDLLGYTLARPESYYIGVATHDDPVIEGAEALIQEHGLSPDQYEFQMLLGVRPEVRERLVEAGHRVRVYVPYGTSWYAYCVRRLKENPKFAGYVTMDVLKDPRMLFGDGIDK